MSESYRDTLVRFRAAYIQTIPWREVFGGLKPETKAILVDIDRELATLENCAKGASK